MQGDFNPCGLCHNAPGTHAFWSAPTGWIDICDNCQREKQRETIANLRRRLN